MTHNHKILYNYASRSRRTNFFRGLDNIISFAHHPDYQIICTLDLNDDELCNDSVKEELKRYPKAKAFYGTSTGKINAINKNLGLADPDWTILINFSDDQVFLFPGYDKVIIEEMDKAFPEGDGFIHFPDNYASNRLATMSIMGRSYFERFGYVYHPSYVSVYCDNEAMLVAQRLGRYAFVNKRIFDHLHPATGLVPMDAQYIHTESFYGVDGPNFKAREARNFDL